MFRFHETSSDVSFSINDGGTKADFTRAPGSIAPESDWQNGWNRMDQLIHQPAAEATQTIISDLKRTAPVPEGVDQVEDILKRAFVDDWQLIEGNSHLYQVRQESLKNPHQSIEELDIAFFTTSFTTE